MRVLSWTPQAGFGVLRFKHWRRIHLANSHMEGGSSSSTRTRTPMVPLRWCWKLFGRQQMTTFVYIPIRHRLDLRGRLQRHAHAFNALFRGKGTIIFPDITYSFYVTYCALYEIGFRQIPLGPDFTIDPRDFEEPNGGIVNHSLDGPNSRGEENNSRVAAHGNCGAFIF